MPLQAIEVKRENGAENKIKIYIKTNKRAVCFFDENYFKLSSHFCTSFHSGLPMVLYNSMLF